MANHAILVRNADDGSRWTEPDTRAYDNESHLQDLLQSDPSQVPGVEVAVAVRELPTDSGPIDVCAVSTDGSITVVECKLAKNSEKRRMVVGQVIDYAAALRSGGYDQFLERWSEKEGDDLAEFLDPGADATLRSNIESGTINLCLVVDLIDDELRRMVEYLNLISRDEVAVTALQLSYFKHGSLEILIPSTFGTEIAAAKSPRREHWTWQGFVDALVDPADRVVAETLRDRSLALEARGHRDRIWFGYKPNGSLFFHPHGLRYGPFKIWQNAAGQLRIFGTWRSWPNLRNDARYAELAEVLGQSHLDGSRGVPASSLDLDTFWTVAVECDLAINELAEPAT